MQAIVPVLLCGGSGTRLWPVARKAVPRHFTRPVGDDTRFQAAPTCLSGQGWAAPVLVTSENDLEPAREQAAAASISPEGVPVEPAPKNTGPAIPAPAAFSDAVAAGAERAACEEIVTFGICPTRAETGNGRLEKTRAPESITPRPLGLAGFAEQPSAACAAQMQAAGGNLRNAGILLAAARTPLAAFQAHAPGRMGPVREAPADAARRGGIVRMARGPSPGAEEISVDRAAMERRATCASCRSPPDGPPSATGTLSGAKAPATRAAS